MANGVDETRMTVSLKLSTDRKVTPATKWTRSKGHEAAVRNAFGLTQRASCPGLTPFCGSCYVDGAARYTAPQRLLAHNLETLQACGSDVAAMVELLDAVVQEYRADHVKRCPEKDMLFRVHWSGDFFSFQYATAWSIVIKRNGDIAFWAYTRSFGFVSPFAGLPNMTLYLSVDPWNVDDAIATHEAHPWTLIAACDDTWDGAEAIVRKVTGRNAPKCPELTSRYALIDTDKGQGACVTCGLCVFGRNNVRFAVKH